jgi:very-short-patch-repair endonuclease
VSFHRRHAIGDYIVDFCSPAARLIIELDGSQHIDQGAYDAQRTRFLEANGYRVLGIWNHHVEHDVECVMRLIEQTLEATA